MLLKSQKANCTTGSFTAQHDLEGRAKTDSRIGLARAGNDRNAFWFPRWEQGKEPFEHDQLTALRSVRQALSGGFVWRRIGCLMRNYLPIGGRSEAICGVDGRNSRLWFPISS